MFVEKGCYVGFEGILNSYLCNLFVELLMKVEDIFKDVDVIILIYIYEDYWDEVV